MEKAQNTEGGGFTLNADEIQKHIMGKMPENDRDAVRRVVLAGMKVLFSKETHNQIFDNIRPEDQVPLEDELGAGAANLMMMLYQESKQTMPQQAIIPAGAILLARACEFIHQTKIAPVTDDIYAEAMQMFTVVMYDKFDPNFRSKAGQTAQPAQKPAGLLAQEA